MDYMSRYLRYNGFINNTLRNRNIDTDEPAVINGTQLMDIINSTQNVAIIDSVSLGINSSELLIITRIKTINTDIDQIKKSLVTEINKVYNQIDNKNIFSSINILWIVDSIEKKAILRYRCNEVIAYIKDSCSFAKNMPLVSTYYVDREIQKAKVSINYLYPPQMLMVPPGDFDINVQSATIDNNKNPKSLKGYVFSVKLYDLVTVYNELGDELFKDNVRYGIGEQMGVDKAIKDTLENNPECFWFRNNGITMIFGGPDRILSSTNEIILKSVGDDEIKFSIINGAQTINAAAEYFYSQEAKSRDSSIEAAEAKKKLDNAKNAQVLLRIIQIEGENDQEEAKKISIALNRQKPIKNEDIAFTNQFVSKLNTHLGLYKLNYSIGKRSEISYSNNEYSLIDFARARKACAGYPGEARGNDSSTLLKLADRNSNGERFADKQIFVPEWYDYNDNDTNKKTFAKYYTPIQFALKLAVKYEQILKSILKKKELDPTSETVVKNGKWYFVAFTIYSLNGNHEDYSDFKYNIDSVSKEQIIELIMEFAKLCSDYSKSQNITINSNTFKVSTTYRDLLLSSYESSDYYKILKALFNLTTKKVYTNKKNSLVNLTFCNKSQKVRSISEAFVYTITECLLYGYNNRKYAKLLDIYITYSSYLSFDEKSSGYFSNRKEIILGNKKVFIGDKNALSVKKRFVNELCEVLELPNESIIWSNEKGIIYSNS